MTSASPEDEAKYQAETGNDFADCHQAKTRATGGLLYQAKTEEDKAKYQS